MSSLRVRYVCQQRVSNILSPLTSDLFEFSNEPLPLTPSLFLNSAGQKCKSSALATRHETNGRISSALESHEFLLNTYFAGVS